MASKAFRKLRQSRKQLDRLYRDIHPVVSAKFDWGQQVYAPRTLGDNVPVAAWYLAEHYLLAWSDWLGLRRRYLRYFGQTEQKFPQSWRRLNGKCRDLSARCLEDQSLDQMISTAWQSRLVVSTLIEESPPSTTQSMYHAIVGNHRRMMLHSNVMSVSDEESSDNIIPIRRGFLPRTFELAHKETHSLSSSWGGQSPTLQRDTLMFLRNYQHTTLSFSWLTSQQSDSHDSHSVLLRLLNRENHMTPSIEQFLSQLDNDPQQHGLLHAVLHRIQDAIAEMGYDNFVDDLTSGDFVGGRHSLVGADGINVIPGEGQGRCCKTLLAVSIGDKRAKGFPAIMQRVREHLIRCMNETKVCIVVCDHWKPDMLAAHLGDLQAHHDRGVQFLFLLVATPGRAVAPVAVDLGDR